MPVLPKEENFLGSLWSNKPSEPDIAREGATQVPGPSSTNGTWLQLSQAATTNANASQNTSERLIFVSPEFYNLYPGTAIKATLRFADHPDTRTQWRLMPPISAIERPVKIKMRGYQVHGDLSRGWHRAAEHRALNEYVDTEMALLATSYAGITFERLPIKERFSRPTGDPLDLSLWEPPPPRPQPSGSQPSGGSPTDSVTAKAPCLTEVKWDEIVMGMGKLELNATPSIPSGGFLPSALYVTPTQESARPTTSANTSQKSRSISLTPGFIGERLKSDKIFVTVRLADKVQQPPGTEPALQDIEAWMEQQMTRYEVNGSMSQGWNQTKEHNNLRRRLDKVLLNLKEVWPGITCVLESIHEQFSPPGGPPNLNRTSMQPTSIPQTVTRVPTGPRGWRVSPSSFGPVTQGRRSNRSMRPPKGPKGGSSRGFGAHPYRRPSRLERRPASNDLCNTNTSGRGPTAGPTLP